MVIKLTADDPRVGHNTPTGRTMPRLDVLGNAYERPIATRNLGDKSQYFVVLPQGFNDKVIIEEASASDDRNRTAKGKENTKGKGRAKGDASDDNV